MPILSRALGLNFTLPTPAQLPFQSRKIFNKRHHFRTCWFCVREVDVARTCISCDYSIPWFMTPLFTLTSIKLATTLQKLKVRVKKLLKNWIWIHYNALAWKDTLKLCNLVLFWVLKKTNFLLEPEVKKEIRDPSSCQFFVMRCYFFRTSHFVMVYVLLHQDRWLITGVPYPELSYCAEAF